MRDPKPVSGATGPPVVLFAIWQSGALGDGGVKSVSEILTRLRAVNPVVLTQRETDCTQAWRSAGIPVTVVPFGGGRPGGASRNGMLALGANRAAYRLATRTHARILHCNDLRAFLNTAAAGLARRSKVVLNVRSIKPPEDAYGTKWRVARTLASRTLLLSHDMRESFDRRVAPLPFTVGSRSLHIYSAVDTSRFRPADRKEKAATRRRLGISETSVAVGSVGLLGPRKAQAELLRAIASSPYLRSDIHFYLIGDVEPAHADYADHCRDLIERYNLDDRVTLVGYRDDIHEWYRALDLTVLTSRREGLARCMLESLACGVPMVSFDVTSAREILEEAGCGQVVAQGDYGKLLGLVDSLATDPSRLRYLGVNGRRVVEQHMEPTAVAAQYERFYLGLMNEPA